MSDSQLLGLGPFIGAFLETRGERIWWCENHESAGNETICNVAASWDWVRDEDKPCSLVERWLVKP